MISSSPSWQNFGEYLVHHEQLKHMRSIYISSGSRAYILNIVGVVSEGTE